METVALLECKRLLYIETFLLCCTSRTCCWGLASRATSHVEDPFTDTLLLRSKLAICFTLGLLASEALN